MINAYDFDGTIYDGDSSVDFFIYSLKRKPSNIILIPIQLWGVLLYLLRIKDKDYMKEKLFSFVKRIDVDSYVKDFWKTHKKKIKKFYLKQKKKSDVIISASPEFLLKPLEKEYNFKVIATKVDKKTGKFISKNCHDYEKIKRYEKEMKKKDNINSFYSDSFKSDKPMLEYAENAYIVKKNNITKIDPNEYKKNTTPLIVKIFLSIFVLSFLTILLGTIFDNKVILEAATLKNNLIALLLSIIILTIVSKITIKKIDKKIIKIFCIISLITMLIVQILVIIYAKNRPGWDWGLVYESALDYTNGKLSSYSMWYFNTFPNNKYMFAIQVILFKVIKALGFLKYSLTATHILNLFFVDLSVILTILTAKKLFGKKGVLYSTVLVLLSSAFYIYLPILYTDTTAMPIPVALIYLFVSMDRQEDKILVNKKNILLSIIFSIVALIGIKIKITSVIVVIAIVICSIINQQVKKQVGIITIILITLLLEIVSINYIESKIHFFRAPNRLPYSHWVMMGLYETPSNVKGKNSIGVYNKELYSYSFKLGPSEKIIEGNKKTIIKKLKKYGPDGYVEFLYRKSLFTWGDGTYNGSRIIAEHKMVKKNIIQDVVYCYGKYFVYYYIFNTAMIFIMYISFIVGGIGNIIKNNKDITIIYMSIFGLFFFLLIWETSSRYLVHYVPLFIVGIIPGLKTIRRKFNRGEENE